LGFGFRVPGLGFRVYGLRVSGLGFRVYLELGAAIVVDDELHGEGQVEETLFGV
jgi:hypothetical protein